MSDNIQSVHFVPQINNLNPNAKTGDKKGNKENKKEFSNHMSAEDNDLENNRHDQLKADNKNTKHKKQNDVNTLHEKTEDDFDSDRGSLLDTEL